MVRVTGELVWWVVVISSVPTVMSYTYNGCSAFLFKAIDPIVNYGQNPSPHLHTFFGSDAISSTTTTSSSLANGCSSCQNTVDMSTYWTPTVFYIDSNGSYQPLAPLFRVYYDSITANSQPIPQDFSMIAGNAKAQSASDPGTVQAGVNWYCTAGSSTKAGQTKLNAEFPTVSCPGLLAINIFFPPCYKVVSGKFVTIYKSGVYCPSDYIEIPTVWLSMRYDVSKLTWPASGKAPLWLASGDCWTMHADFFNGWPEAQTKDMVKHKDSGGLFFLGTSTGFFDNDPPCTVQDPYATPFNYKPYIIGHR